MGADLREYTLLYVEDERKIQLKMGEYFESYFKTVYYASDGNEALKLYHHYYPDVVILDINIPKINGLEVARQIRNVNKRTRIIIMSAHSEKELLLQATEIDMSKYLIKPVSPFELKKALEKITYELSWMTTNLTQKSFDYHIGKEGLIFKNNSPLSLSKSEHKVLGLLIKNFGNIVRYESFFYDELNSPITNEATLRNIIAKLRKICPDIIIKNIKDVGYISNKAE
ncbi:MAG: response regulator [Sulfuricurvum sp.]|uniref:response regulator transcription factor n=1 Tax=Sulfuricurvum sp. TaxID=2025608 RepID=UPI002603EC36|nr:response regulator [Sulfuricurvum sp.]MDD2830473.1 response regulator [Sulfuricurvum sp.]MDD4948598.1 response regulator [Sulfuricurvum sp.]